MEPKNHDQLPRTYRYELCGYPRHVEFRNYADGAGPSDGNRTWRFQLSRIQRIIRQSNTAIRVWKHGCRAKYNHKRNAKRKRRAG